MKLYVSTEEDFIVEISDREGYSPDKLDDWCTRAAVLIEIQHASRSARQEEEA